jgi:Mrp family chromosome partitioning ATPase/capsular polysaccharide biosynthesis protein
VELSDLVASIRRYWLLILIIPLVAVAAVWKSRPPETYTASATVEVFPAGGVTDLNDDAVSLLMPALLVWANSQAFASSVSLSVPAAIADAPVTISTSGDTTSGLLSITASSTDRSAVAQWANAYAGELIVSPGSVAGYADLRAVSSAGAPSVSTSDQKAVAAGAALAALLISVLAALGLDALRIQRADPERRARRYGAPVLAVVPKLRRRSRNAGPEPLLAASEAIRCLAVEIAIARRAEPFDALAVVSDRQGTGCSTVTSALGWVLASNGLDVVIVDADFRRGAQGANLGLQDPANGALQTVSSNPTLTYLGLPDIFRHPAAMLSMAGARVAGQSRSDTSITVIDAPPYDDGPEADAIGIMAGTVLMVVNGRRADSAAVRRQLLQLRARNVRVLGLVINHPGWLRRAARGPHGAPPPGPQHPLGGQKAAANGASGPKVVGTAGAAWH